MPKPKPKPPKTVTIPDLHLATAHLTGAIKHMSAVIKRLEDAGRDSIVYTGKKAILDHYVVKTLQWSSRLEVHVRNETLDLDYQRLD